MRTRVPKDVLALYDSLPVVQIDTLLGSWRGSELPTGHPLDGLLAAFGWHGKRFDSADSVHPLVFDRARGAGLVSVQPALMPIGLVLKLGKRLPHPAVGGVFRLLQPLMTTSAPAARLRMIEHRGLVTAAMVYDALPIIDVFRHVDEDTLLGIMDVRGSDQPYPFVLHREDASPS
ncbi:DUF4334 domain-containing protein [soil metagenome]